MIYVLKLFTSLPHGGVEKAVYDINPDVHMLTWSTTVPGGFNGLDLAMTDPGMPLYGHTPEDTWLDGFVHLELSAGARIIWEGRVMRLVDTGGYLTDLSAQGYGVTATKDSWWPGTGLVQFTSGGALKAALQYASPMIAVGGRDLFQDPGIIHAIDDFKNQTPAQIIDTISKEGGSDGRPWDFTVYDKRIAKLGPRTFSRGQNVLYQVDLDHSVTRERVYENAFSSVTVLPATQFTPYQEAKDASFLTRYGLQRRTILSVPAGLSTYLGWQFAQNQLALNAGPTTAYTIKRSKDAGGFAFPSGAIQSVENIRAGEWVRIGDSGPFEILSTTFQASTGDFEARVNAFPAEYFYKYIQVKALANHFAAGTNPATGLRV